MRAVYVNGRGWLAGDWPSTGGVLNITAAAWTAGFHWWRSGNKKQTQDVSKYMLVLAVCLVVKCSHRVGFAATRRKLLFLVLIMDVDKFVDIMLLGPVPVFMLALRDSRFIVSSTVYVRLYKVHLA